MEVVVVTGASKGLGAALVEQLLSPDRRVVGIARSSNDALAEAARTRGAWLDWYLQDLSDTVATDALARSIMDGMPRDASRYVLVNNAALAEPVGPIATLDPAVVVRAIDANLTATMILTTRFLAATATLDADRRVLNISSGLGRRPMDGTATYCVSKAGMDMFTRCINAEPDDPSRAKRKARAVSLAPGVVDTGMQVFMRGQDPGTFPEGRYFADMKRDGKLASPAEVAAKIVRYLDRDDFGATEIDDIRNA